MRSGVFVTGGTGFVGGAVLRRLTDGDRWVKALARTRTGGEMVAGAGALPVIGDLFEPEVLDEGMAGCGVVFHVAGLNQMCPADPAELDRVNVEGSRAVVRAALRAGVERLVYTSSAAALGERRGTVGNERSEHRGGYLSEYERSKHLAELAVAEAAAGTDLEVVTVNPSSVQGPGRSGGSARLLLHALGRRVPVLIDTDVSVVDIDDCARGHLLAAERGAAGERYVLSGASQPVRDAVDVLRRVTGARIRPVYLGRRTVATLGPAVARMAGRMAGPEALCPAMVRTLVHGHRYDGSRATEELGLDYTPFADTVARTVQWFVDYGFLRRRLPNYPRLGA